MDNEVACDLEVTIDPYVAAVELLPTFKVLARGLCPKDRHLQEDLMQEMALATLQSPLPRSASAFCVAALWRAKNYLHLWNEQSRRPGCEINAHSVDDPRRAEIEAEPVRLPAAMAEEAVEKLRQWRA